ncbi:MAG: zinc-binding alcohol dehydrogenase family protein [Schleiferiaceae bacterium]
MKGWQISSYGGTEVFECVDLPYPTSLEDWVTIEVKAFGLNRSELYTRQGHSGDAVTLPRVLGIECVGIVTDGGKTDLQPGQKVAAAMGNMGRKFDGGYATVAQIPRSNVFPFESNLPWDILGALPETYLTAWGAIHEAIQLQPNTSLLIRGGTSAAGLACISIAKDMGCTVFATTRSEKKKPILREAGVDHILLEKPGGIAEALRKIQPEGVAGVVEFVGIEETILDGLKTISPQGTLCMVGFLGNQWDYKFFPWMPSTINLTIYSSETIHSTTQTQALQTIVQKVEQGIYKPNIHQVFPFDKLPIAQQLMEENRAAGKLVVLTPNE